MDDGERHATIQLRTVRALCALRKWGDHFDYAVTEDHYVRLRVRGKVDDKHLAIQFPRSPAMSDHYQAIREWFARHRVEWKDRTHEGERFMTAELPLDPEWVDGLLYEAGQTVFGADTLRLINRTPFLYIEYVIARRPRLWFMCVLLLFIATLGFWLYEFSRGFTLTTPSLSNFTPVEFGFTTLVLLCTTVARSLRHRPIISRYIENVGRTWMPRAFVFVPVLLAFLMV